MQTKFLVYRFSVITMCLALWAVMSVYYTVPDSFKDVIIMVLGSVTGFHSHAALTDNKS